MPKHPSKALCAVCVAGHLESNSSSVAGQMHEGEEVREVGEGEV